MSNESYFFCCRKIIRVNINRMKNIIGSIIFDVMIVVFLLFVFENMLLINVCFLFLIYIFDYIVYNIYNV